MGVGLLFVTIPIVVQASGPYAEKIDYYADGRPRCKNTLSADKASAIADGQDIITVEMGFLCLNDDGNWVPGAGSTHYPNVSGSGNSYPSSVDMPAHVSPVSFQLTSTVSESKTITYQYDAYLGDRGDGPSIGVTFNSASSPTIEESSQSSEESSPASDENAQKPAVPTLLTINGKQLGADKKLTGTIYQGDKIVLSGKTSADSTDKLYIYSDPTTAESAEVLPERTILSP